MSQQTILVGARDPESVAIDETRGVKDNLDFTTVTSVELEVLTPRGTSVSWAWSIAIASATALTLSHTFAADGSDVPAAGRYTVRGWLVTPSTRRRITPVHLTAVEDL